MGHLGLTPQSIYKFGTYVELREGKPLLMCVCTDAGCFALILEKVPAKLATSS